VRRTIVVKLGSALVAHDDGHARTDTLTTVAAAIAERQSEAPNAIAIVSSGAIALGWPRLSTGRAKRTLAQLQAASALGQAELQHRWQTAFNAHQLPVAQVLLTATDLTERRSYLNVRAALTALFDARCIPVINENDATATDEISFGDNDVLAAQTAILLRASQLMLLTAAGGIHVTPPNAAAEAEIIGEGTDVQETMFGPGSALGRGGIASKVAAARLAAAGGVDTFIAAPADLARLLDGGQAGTRFRAQVENASAFKLWLRYGTRATSRLTVDDGAAEAIQARGASLLAVGILGWSNQFVAGDALLICNRDGHEIARGIAAIDSARVQHRPKNTEVVHRDRLALSAP
jgi:glutamate 5-kinase